MMFRPYQLGVTVRGGEDFGAVQRHHRRVYGAKFPEQDVFTAVGVDFRKAPVKHTCRCVFDYEAFPGMEFVLSSYEGAGWNFHWLYSHPGNVWLSHFGQYVTEPAEIDWWRWKYTVLQETVTTEHSNPAINKQAARFHLVVLDTRGQLGQNLQLIRRITIIESDLLKERLRAAILKQRSTR
jgi:hypothetical protein